jgi:HD-GYP domain-containing protein (c-di-GMP phosphodiesterase class II)
MRLKRESLEKNYHKILARMNTPHSDLKHTASEILDFIIEIFGADKADITIFNQEFDIHSMALSEEAAVKLRLTRGYSEEQWNSLTQSGVLLQSISFALEKKESRVVPDTSEEPDDARKLSEYLSHGSWMNYVLVMNEKVLANIHLAKKETHYYREKDLKRLEYLSMLLATAINLSHMWEKERKLMLNFIQSLNKALEMRDEYTAGHVERVGFYARNLARKLNMTASQIESVEIAAILHDIGKIGVGDNVLKKKSGLSWEEKELIRKHVPITDEILENLHHYDEARKIARYHHETYDGKGYMYGLKGEEIPLGSKILAIADAFDAMTSDRPYRKAFFVEEALATLNDRTITQWDRSLIEIFDGYIRSEEFLIDAEERGLIHYSDAHKIFYDRDTSILRFKDLSSFFKGKIMETRLKKRKKMYREDKIELAKISKVESMASSRP